MHRNGPPTPARLNEFGFGGLEFVRTAPCPPGEPKLNRRIHLAAYLVAFLASDRARSINAANLRIDGGAADAVA